MVVTAAEVEALVPGAVDVAAEAALAIKGEVVAEAATALAPELLEDVGALEALAGIVEVTDFFVAAAAAPTGTRILGPAPIPTTVPPAAVPVIALAAAFPASLAALSRICCCLASSLAMIFRRSSGIGLLSYVKSGT